jgi:hypothetical protein
MGVGGWGVESIGRMGGRKMEVGWVEDGGWRVEGDKMEDGGWRMEVGWRRVEGGGWRI